MDRDVAVVIFAITVVNWMFSEWLWALFRVRRRDRVPRRSLSAILNSFGAVTYLFLLDATSIGPYRPAAALLIVLFCFVFYAGDILTARAEETGFPGLEVDIPGFDPEHRPLFSATVILIAQVGLLAIIAAVVR